MRIRPLTVLLAAVTVAALAACVPTPPPAPTLTPVAQTPSPTPSPGAPEAVMTDEYYSTPSTCAQLVGPLEETFFADGYTLFSSTDGTGTYYPIPSTQDGGSPFSCWYGKDGVDLSSFELAAQPVDEAQHEGIVAVLGSGGFDMSSDGGITTYVQVGDQGTTPAIVHVLRFNSWLTAYAAFGGADQVAVLTGYLEEVADQLYN